LKGQKERKKHRYKNEPKNNPEKKQDKLNREEDFNRSTNQHYLLEKFVHHSNTLAQPNEVSSTEGSSIIIPGETIPMAYSSSFLDNRNTVEKEFNSNLNANDSSSSNVNLGKICS
jgi:hypothetical protein